MDLAVVSGRAEAQAVFVANELRNFGEDLREFLGGLREVGATAVGGGNEVELVRGASDTFGGGLAFRIDGERLFGAFGRRVGEIGEIAAERDGKDVDVGGFQMVQETGDLVGRRSVDAGGEQYDGFFSGNAGEPVERGGKTGGEVKLAEANVEAQLIESAGGNLFVGNEIEDRLGVLVIAGDSDAVGGGKAVEENFDGLQVAFLQEIDGGAGFDEEKDLGRFIDIEKIGDGLGDTIIEEQEVMALEAGEELAAGVGDGNADADAFDADTNVGSLRNLLSLRRQDAGGEKQTGEEKGQTATASQ